MLVHKSVIGSYVQFFFIIIPCVKLTKPLDELFLVKHVACYWIYLFICSLYKSHLFIIHISISLLGGTDLTDQTPLSEIINNQHDWLWPDIVWLHKTLRRLKKENFSVLFMISCFWLFVSVTCYLAHRRTKMMLMSMTATAGSVTSRKWSGPTFRLATASSSS